ncbi:MAG: peptide MFS transporter [Bacteroidota bacterium]|nr:peptide MFS transporter [Bacteroidota bacterium]
MKHPKALYLLFFTEMWERFSYYGMRALLTIFLVTSVSEGGFGWNAKDAGQLYGIYTGLAYVTPLLGGYLADRFLGSQYAVLIGATIMALGHGSLALTGVPFFYLGISLLIIGNGFFKPNISSMVGQLYPEGSPLKDAAYTIFYMGINIGAFCGTLICGYLGERIGWHYGFGAAGIFMTMGLINFAFNRKILGDIGKINRASRIENRESNIKLSKFEKDRIVVILVLSFFSIVFWMAFEQAGSSISLFALNYTDRYIPFFDFTVPASWLQSLNALFVIILAPVFSKLWVILAERKMSISNPNKFAIALLILALGFGVLVIGSLNIPQSATTASQSMLWIVGAILLHTIGELCLSPVGLSSVNKLAPLKMTSLMFGAWFFASAIGNYLSGAVGGLIEEISKQQSMATFFMITVIFALLASAIMFLISGKLKKMMHGVE